MTDGRGVREREERGDESSLWSETSLKYGTVDS